MNVVHDGPQCSLISYVVPPGLSRVPVVGPTDTVPYTVTPLETVSAKSGNDNPRSKQEAVHPTTNSACETVSETPGLREDPSTKSSTHRPISSALRLAKKLSHTSTLASQSQPPRKSCLTRSSTPALVPARLNLKKKTVAFGKTVNVSQTIEGTSRLAKLRNIMDKKESLQKEPACDSENKENEAESCGKEADERAALMDILKDVKSSLEALRIRDEERAEELRSVRQMITERGKEVDLLRGMFADYVGKDCPPSFDSRGNVSPKRTVREAIEPPPERIGRKHQVRSQQRSNRLHYSSPTRELGSQFDSEPSDDDEITFEEFRRLLTTNPTLRQFVADIRAEESDQRAGYADRRSKNGRGVVPRWRDSPRAVERCKESKVERGRRDDLSQRGPRGAKYTEKVTVERSVRCSPQDLAKYSVDTRRYLENQILDENVETVESVYQPGESVSYYPERTHRYGYAGDTPDSNDDSVHEGRAYRDYAAVEERRRLRRNRRTDRF